MKRTKKASHHGRSQPVVARGYRRVVHGEAKKFRVQDGGPWGTEQRTMKKNKNKNERMNKKKATHNIAEGAQ